MSATLCPTTDIDLDVCNVSIATNDEYETTPMAVALPPQQADDEEVLYAGFEEAISGRCQAWKRLSDGSLNSVQHTSKKYATAALPTTEALTTDQMVAFVQRNWQSGVLIACLALMFILIGFDVMGMLVLAMR
ncbi:hypothetical protein [Dictyobacter aurantiacus]|uniref:Uncharacterized protein n=1 Tax=Dictyobacter aurantiacus TaxID=1936993 RepID=A0A401ZEB0_9CHLR|nr:hypothetical protein [Dictyobacter aurantiacus]GCE05202.1 hypothetical protein KDAU_25310 [Dictyobacter aurantiacus]